jgi:hypothetical protein
MRWLALVTLVACGDNLAGPDAACDGSCVTECRVALTGNTEETSSGPDVCPVLLTGEIIRLAFLIPSPALGTSLGIRIDLGPAPTPGDYSSTTTATWSAIAVKPIMHPRGGCVFNAGNASSPAGHFLLHLDSFEPPVVHGSLELMMFVLPQTAEGGAPSDCGTETTEEVSARF